MSKLRSQLMIVALASTLAAGLAVPATAQEFSWTGFYAGVNLGGGFGHAGADVVGLPTTNTRSLAPYSSAINMSGVIGGAFERDGWPMRSSKPNAPPAPSAAACGCRLQRKRRAWSPRRPNRRLLRPQCPESREYEASRMVRCSP